MLELILILLMKSLKNITKKNNSPNNQVKGDTIKHNLILKVFRDIVNRRK